MKRDLIRAAARPLADAACDPPGFAQETLLALIEDLRPQGVIENHLVRRMAAAIVRAHRAERMESECLGLAGRGTREGALGVAVTRDANGPKALDLVRRYARSADAQFGEAMSALVKLRSEKGRALRPSALASAPLGKTRISLSK